MSIADYTKGYKYALITLRRGRKRTVLVGPKASLFDVSTRQLRDEVDAIVAGYFAAGWRTADFTYLHPYETMPGGYSDITIHNPNVR